MNTKQFILGTLIITAVILAPLSAQVAQTGNKGLLRTHSAQTLGKGFWGVGASGYLSIDDKFIYDAIAVVDTSPLDNYAYYLQNLDPTYLSTYYNIGYGFFNFLDANITLPYYLDNTGADGEKSVSGIGDIAMSIKFRYPPYEHSPIFNMTYFGELTLPTANKNSGLFTRSPSYVRSQNINPKHIRILGRTEEVQGLRFLNPDSTPVTDPIDLFRITDSLKDTAKSASHILSEDIFYGTRSPSFLAKMLWTLDFAEIDPEIPLRWNLNFGAHFSGNSSSDNLFVLASSLEWTPHELLTIFTDFFGQARFEQLAASFDLGKEPLILGSGFALNLPVGLHIAASFDKCFTFQRYKYTYYNETQKMFLNTKVFPDIGISAGISWNGALGKKHRDRDGDGIPDHLDACPDEPEDVDGFEDQDGCPDYDNDKDGILDIRDKCPNEAEDFDGFEDHDGCPDYDNDRDNIPDIKDKCPNEPEDIDGFEDDDGCPEADNDRDGIPDVSDKCPNDPEDIDGFEDQDGCPEYDNDGDGILDKSDKCMDIPENFNGYQDEDGCPDEKVAEVQPKIVLEGVNFKTGSSELTSESFAILDNQIEPLLAYPDVCIEIRGHTDNIGKRESNLALSQSRAESVKAYIVQKGISEKRVFAVGKGPDEPIEDNRKADGRARNRRIEMHRIPCK